MFFICKQAAVLWSAVARVLHDEAQGKLSKIAALFAISNQTMGHERKTSLIVPITKPGEKLNVQPNQLSHRLRR